MGVALWALSGCHSEWIIIQMNYWCMGERRAGGEEDGRVEKRREGGARGAEEEEGADSEGEGASVGTAA